jgi:hypothetical protein
VILVDTNVLLDVVEDDPTWADWSQRQLDAASLQGSICINPVVHAELSMAFARIEELEAVVADGGIEVEEMPRALSDVFSDGGTDQSEAVIRTIFGTSREPVLTDPGRISARGRPAAVPDIVPGMADHPPFAQPRGSSAIAPQRADEVH